MSSLKKSIIKDDSSCAYARIMNESCGHMAEIYNSPRGELEFHYTKDLKKVLWLLNIATAEIMKKINEEYIAFEKYKAEKDSDETIEMREEQPF